MATIFYSLMGEGRGHAARARAMVERLRESHHLTLFTSHDALDFLRREYADDPSVEVHEIAGLKFHYSDGRLDNVKTVREALALYRSLGRHTDRLEARFRDRAPNLVISDFEPLLPRVARRLRVPVLSVDHQHFLSKYDLSTLPRELRAWAWLMSWSIWAFGIRQDRTVVSAFYKPPLRVGCEDVVQVGPLLRRSVVATAPSSGTHLLSYLRRATPPKVIEILAAAPAPVRVYGLGERPAIGSVTFHPIDERTFVNDLASCDAVVSAAGNQLLGEALWFGKPLLVLPERSHYEQRINAAFVEQMQVGEQRVIQDFTPDALHGFLSRRDVYRERLSAHPTVTDGVAEVEHVIATMLDGVDGSTVDAPHAARESA